jgi:hypothetical protein
VSIGTAGKTAIFKSQLNSTHFYAMHNQQHLTGSGGPATEKASVHGGSGPTLAPGVSRNAMQNETICEESEREFERRETERASLFSSDAQAKDDSTIGQNDSDLFTFASSLARALAFESKLNSMIASAADRRRELVEL